MVVHLVMHFIGVSLRRDPIFHSKMNYNWPFRLILFFYIANVNLFNFPTVNNICKDPYCPHFTEYKFKLSQKNHAASLAEIRELLTLSHGV